MSSGERSLALRKLVGQQNAAAHLQRIFNGLQARRERLPFIVPKVGMRSAGSNDEIVITQLEAVKLDGAALKIEALHLAQQHLHVFMLAQDLANGRGNLRRRNPGRRHLIEQRLEGVMIAAIDQRDLDRQPGQRFEQPSDHQIRLRR